jgi:hypothetical protein
LEAAGTFRGLDALAGHGVEDHAWDTGAAGGATASGGAGEVHVGAGWLAVSALVPNQTGWADLMGHAIVFGTFPDSTAASASVALFFTCSSVLVVSSLEDAFAVSDWYALLSFLINGFTRWAVASCKAFFYMYIGMNLSTCLSANLGTFLVNLSTSRASYSACSTDSPCVHDNSGKSTLAGILGKNRAQTYFATSTRTNSLFAHSNEWFWIDNGVTAAEDTRCEGGTLSLSGLEELHVVSASV